MKRVKFNYRKMQLTFVLATSIKLMVLEINIQNYVNGNTLRRNNTKGPIITISNDSIILDEDHNRTNDENKGMLLRDLLNHFILCYNPHFVLYMHINEP